MRLFKYINKRILALMMIFITLFLVFGYSFQVRADNGWITETKDGYYSIGNNLEVKLDILNGDKQPIDDKNLFYNGQKVFLKLNWRAIDKVTTGTSLEVVLPINTGGSTVGFETPLLRNIEVVSKDGTILTSVKKDGSSVTSFFDASKQKPIEAKQEGEIFIPHNIFVNSDASKVSGHNLEVKFIADDGSRKIIKKQINKIANGLKLDNLELLDKITKQKIEQLDMKKNSSGVLKVEYFSGDYGIKNGDSVLIKYNDFGGENKTAKLKPFASAPINIQDNSGNIIGKMTFVNSSNIDNNTYSRIEFNESFANVKNIKGFINSTQDIIFSKNASEKSLITLQINSEVKNIVIAQIAEKNSEFISRINTSIDNGKIVRKNIVINMNDLLKEKNKENISDIKAQNEVSFEESNKNIDFDSIRIVKILSTKGNNITDFGADIMTLKSTENYLESYSGSDVFWTSQRGLTLNEFEEYLGKKDIITPKKDKNNIIGFDVKSLFLNEPKGLNGEYVIVSSDQTTKRIPRDNKIFGYLIYYNEKSPNNTFASNIVTSNSITNSIITNNSTTNEITLANNQNTNTEEDTAVLLPSTQAILKILKTDSNGIPLSNIYYQLIQKKDKEEIVKGEYKTSRNGYLEIPKIEKGNYILKEKNSNLYKINEKIDFSVDDVNVSNLDLKNQNKDRTDLLYENKNFIDNNDKNQQTYINIIKTDFETGQFKIHNKDIVSKELLKNAEFRLYNEDKKIEGEEGLLVANENGEIITKKLPLGKYFVIAEKSPNGYELDNTKYPVILSSATEIKSYDIFSSGKGFIKIFNIDPNTKSFSRSPLTGSKFNLFEYEDTQQPIETITINEKGFGISSMQSFGRYYLLQISAPEGYKLTGKQVPITIDTENINASSQAEITINTQKDKSEETEIPEEQNNNQTSELENDDTPLGALDLEAESSNDKNEEVIISETNSGNNNSSNGKINPTTADKFDVLIPITLTGVFIFSLLLVKQIIEKKNRKIYK